MVKISRSEVATQKKTCALRDSSQPLFCPKWVDRDQKFHERCHPYIRPCILNLVQIGCTLPDLIQKDLFFGLKSKYNISFQPTYPGTRDRGRPRKTWSACVRNDMTICNLDGVNPLDRNSWRTSVRSGVAYPGVRDNRSTLNTKTGYDDDDDVQHIQDYASLIFGTHCSNSKAWK